MSTAAKLLGNFGDVDVAFRTHAGAIETGRAFLEKRYRFNFADRQRIVNEAVSIFIGSFRLLLHFDGLPHPGDVAGIIPLRSGQHAAQQFDLWPAITGEDGFRAFGRTNAGAHQFGGNLKSSFGGVGVMKRSGVGKQRRINAIGDFPADADAGGFAEIVDHLADGRRRGIDPIHRAEQFRRGMVIDVDDELLFQIA